VTGGRLRGGPCLESAPVTSALWCCCSALLASRPSRKRHLPTVPEPSAGGLSTAAELRFRLRQSWSRSSDRDSHGQRRPVRDQQHFRGKLHRRGKGGRLLDRCRRGDRDRRRSDAQIDFLLIALEVPLREIVVTSSLEILREDPAATVSLDRREISELPHFGDDPYRAIAVLRALPAATSPAGSMCVAASTTSCWSGSTRWSCSSRSTSRTSRVCSACSTRR